MSDRRSVGANAAVANVFSGNQYEYLLQSALVEFGLVGSAVGLNASVSTGQDILQNDQEVNAQNRMPIYPDDFVLKDVVGPGERIVVGYRNTTGAAITAFTIAKITYMG